METKTKKLLNELLQLHPKYIDLSLDRLKELLHKLGNPQFYLPKTIHIAGTNGKGSVLSFIKNILVLNGFSCDAYISPHLTKFNERIVLDNKHVSTKKLLDSLEFVKKVNNNNPITFFEITTAAAFMLFNKSNSDFLILETGLGGRLDATNIIPKKLCSIITPISYDHEEYLGKTLKKITKEKLGIIKNSDFVLIGNQKNEVKQYITNKLLKTKNVYFYGKNFRVNKIKKNNFEFYFSGKKSVVYRPNLNGSHQVENASIALAFSEIIKKNNFQINFRQVNIAIKNTYWPGRLEILSYQNKKIILDGSHNVDGAKKLRDFLKFKNLKPIVLFGMLNNKKIDNFLKIIKKQLTNVIAIKIPNEKNAFTTNEIKEKCNSLSINCIKAKNINEALKMIRESNQNVFMITGSLYLIGKIRNRFIN